MPTVVLLIAPHALTSGTKSANRECWVFFSDLTRLGAIRLMTLGGVLASSYIVLVVMNHKFLVRLVKDAR